MKLSERQLNDLRSLIDKLEAIVKLAGSNFPASTDMYLEVSGQSTARISVASYDLAKLCDAGRLALSDQGCEVEK